MYATSRPYKYRTIQDNLRIELFARKHHLTIEQVEIALELDDAVPVKHGRIYDLRRMEKR